MCKLLPDLMPMRSIFISGGWVNIPFPVKFVPIDFEPVVKIV
jgi:hypothetical protein